MRYAAVFLTPESRELLLACFPPAHGHARADHVTLAYRPTPEQLAALLPQMKGGESAGGRLVEVRVTGEAWSPRAQACAVELDPRSGVPPTTSEALHVTVSFAEGASAAEAGPMLRDAFLAAITGDGNGGGGGNGSGQSLRFKHLDEPLVLYGRLGVELEESSSTTTRNDTAMMGSGKGDVVLSAEELLERVAGSAASSARPRQPQQTLSSFLPAAPSSSSSPSTTRGNHHQLHAPPRSAAPADHHAHLHVLNQDDADDDDREREGAVGLLSTR